MNGLIGGIAARNLAADFDLRALDRRSVPEAETHTASIVDADAIRPAFEGVDTVVHLAGYMGGDEDQHMQVNVRGTYNVFRAAREAGVRRVVFASSGAVQGGYEKQEPFLAMIEARVDDIPTPRPLLTHRDPVWPLGMYGASKLFGEGVARAVADEHGLSAICIRLGRVRPEDRPSNAREAAVHLSHRDAAQIVRRCVEAPDDVGFEIVYGVSDNFTRFRDIEHARDAVGFVPLDGIPHWPLE